MKKSVTMVAVLLLAISLTACSAAGKAIKEVNAVDVKAYMEEDQKAVKEFKDAYIKDFEKAKDKEVEKLVKQFKKDLKTFATKEDKVEAYKKLVLKQAGDKKAEVEKVLKDYAKKLKEVKSNKELEKLTAEINAKLTEKTGQTVAVTTSEIETSTPAAKAAAQQQSSGNASASGSHVKQRVWVVDQAAWTETVYETETYQDTAYIVNGKDFGTNYDAAYVYWESLVDEDPSIGGFGATTVTRTRQVPRHINHPEQGHWEYK